VLDGRLKESLGFGEIGTRAWRQALLAELIRLPGRETLRGDRVDARPLARGQRRFECTCDRGGNFTLDREDVGGRGFPVVAPRPDVLVSQAAGVSQPFSHAPPAVRGSEPYPLSRD
jgi:hypothetical protein